MQATQTLPAGYTAQGGISLKENRRLFFLLNLLGIPWFILCALFFIVMASMLGSWSQAGNSGSVAVSLTTLLLALVVIVATLFAVIVLHEAAHGLFFWMFTRSRPTFGFKGLYAYAAAPGWYIPRLQFFTVGLAPLLLISLAGLLVLPFIRPPVSLVLIVALISNATGAIGDLYMVARLFFMPSGVLIEDQGNSIRWYVPAARA